MRPRRSTQPVSTFGGLPGRSRGSPAATPAWAAWCAPPPNRPYVRHARRQPLRQSAQFGRVDHFPGGQNTWPVLARPWHSRARIYPREKAAQCQVINLHRIVAMSCVQRRARPALQVGSEQPVEAQAPGPDGGQPTTARSSPSDSSYRCRSPSSERRAGKPFNDVGVRLRGLCSSGLEKPDQGLYSFALAPERAHLHPFARPVLQEVLNTGCNAFSVASAPRTDVPADLVDRPVRLDLRVGRCPIGFVPLGAWYRQLGGAEAPAWADAARGAAVIVQLPVPVRCSIGSVQDPLAFREEG